MSQPVTLSDASFQTELSKPLLACAVVAGPFYFAVSLVQALIRPGFDLTRHPLSLLSTGDLGWIQIANFIASGVLVTAGAVGMRRALRGGRGSTWGPLLIGLFGVGLISAGIFAPDPAAGFPPGTPAGTTTISTRGLLHFVVAEVAFLGLIAACFVFARRFADLGQRGWVQFSLAAGVVFFAGLVAIAAGGGASWSLLAFWIGILLAWGWLSAVATHLRAGRA